MKNKSDYLPNLASNLMIYGIFFLLQCWLNKSTNIKW